METKTIQITGIETKYIQSMNNTVFEILSGKDKYTFWQTFPDGNNTPAYDQFQKFRFKNGDTVEISVVEAPGKPYMNKGTGQMVTPINRSIRGFVMQDKDTPSIPNIPQTQFPNPNLSHRIEQLEIDVAALKEMVDQEQFEAQRAMMSAAVPDINKKTQPEEVNLDNLPF
jgi:hypothetical protein